MSAKRSGQPKAPRTCAKCGAVLSGTRPVFLVLDDVGGIVGPYHAGCAEKISLERKKDPSVRKLPGVFFGRRVAVQVPLPEGEKESA